jgi:uncharacterized Ntn-hydrolase superfamily protein
MTYSIVARDAASGELGIAVQSRYFGAGRVVPWIEAGVGVIASQAFANPMYGHEGLRLLREGLDPQAALDKLVAKDPSESRRQVAIMNAAGRVAVHTGRQCVAAAGHAVGASCSAQGNMLARDTVWKAMVGAFEHASGTLADRLLAAMDAAECEGGDLRGRQAAGLVVVSGTPSGVVRRDVLIDVRVDDHAEPLDELRRLARHAQAHVRANRAMEHILAGEMDAALSDLEVCCADVPEEPTFHFRRALALLSLQRLAEARDALQQAVAIHPGWGELLLRFADAGLTAMPREQLVELLGAQDRVDLRGTAQPLAPPSPE